MAFEHARKDSSSTDMYDIRDGGHVRALGELFCLLRRNLEIETLEVIHDWLYKHKDMGKPKAKRKKTRTGKTRKRRKSRPARNTSAPPSVQSFAVDLLTLLFALKQHFQSLARGPTKLRAGELCKRLYCYYFFLRGKPPNLSQEDVRSLPGRLRVGRNEMPSEKPLDAFYAWIGASGEDEKWWGNRSPEEKWTF